MPRKKKPLGDAIAKSGKPAGAGGIFQFKMTLRGSAPPIWRRIQIRDCTLSEFHQHIQNVFGWSNSHLHQFEIAGEHYGELSIGEFGFGLEDIEDESRFHLSDFLRPTTKKARWTYVYDFGDNWEHVIEFEGMKASEPDAEYPRCTAGARACPPEDCGGVWGYASLLEAIANPKHESHKEMSEWAGDIDPEKFDADRATAAMR